MREIVIHSVNAQSERPVLLQQIKEARRQNPDRNIMVIVPESMTLEYEQYILKDRDGMMRVSVKSVKKLQKGIFGTYGYGSKYKNKEPQVITKSAEIAKLYVIMKEHRADLLFCKNPRMSVAEKIYDTLHELRDHQYGYDDLQYFTQKPDIPPLLRDKLHDFALFMKEIDEDYSKKDKISEWGVYSLFLDNIIKYGIFRNTTVILVGFDIFYPRLVRLCEAILTGEADCRIQAIFLEPDFVKDIYAELEDSISDANKYLNRKQSVVRPVSVVRAEAAKLSPVEYDPAILHLAKATLGVIESAPDDMKHVYVYNAPNQYAECLHAAQQLIDWHKEGCAWRDMAVVMNVENTTGNLLPLVLESAGIPHFMASQRTSMLCSDVYYLAKVISAAGGYELQDMVDIMKSGLLPVSEDECQHLEIYAQENGITGVKWTKPFQNIHKDPVIAEMDSIRERLVSPILKLHERIADRKSTAEMQAKAIWDYLEETGFYQNLRSKEAEYREAGYMHYADQVRQSWHIICKVLNIIAMDVTKNHLSLESLNEIFSMCLESESLQSIPQTADAVLVDKPRVFAPGMRKNCILLSLQEVVITSSVTLLTNMDKEWIVNNDREEFRTLIIEKTDHALCARNLRGKYRGIMSATDRVCLSASTLAHNGSPLVPDTLIESACRELKEKCPENIKGGAIINDIRPYAHDATLELLAQKLRELVFHGTGDLAPGETSTYSEQWKKAYDYLMSHEPDTVRNIIKAMNAKPFADNIPPEIADKLFQTDITSVSELEKFASCPYAHFMMYGIRPAEPLEYRFRPDQEGNFYHNAMKAYVERARKDMNFPHIDQGTIIRYFNEAVQPLIEELKEGVLAESTLSRMELAEYVQTVRTSAMYVTYWLAEGKYRPVGCEVSFGKKDSHIPALEMRLSNGKTVRLYGVVDRFDLFTDTDGKIYGRIVDYKRSEHTLDRESVENGYSLQLPLYLSAFTEATPGMTPSGALYQHIHRAVIETDSEDEEEIRRKVMSSAMLKGMYLENESVDKANGGAVKKPTATSRNDLMSLSESEMADVLDRSKKKAIEHAENISSGVISIDPRIQGNRTACDFCPGRNVCMIGNRKKFAEEEE